MITYAKRQIARHRLRVVTAQQAFDQLQLPWLCPALLDHSKATRSTFTAPQAVRLPRLRLDHHHTRLGPNNAQLAKSQTRRYAYATESQQAFPHDDSYIPFELSPGLGHSDAYPATAWQARPDFTKIQFDPLSPLIIRDSLSEPNRIFRLSDGIGGEPEEMFETLMACLHVGRFDRAAAVLRRLNDVFKPEIPELIELHNEYLVHLVENVAVTNDQVLLREVHTWYTREIRAKNIPPNSITIAYMIRASLLQPDLTTSPQIVSQHMRYAEDSGFADDAVEILKRVLSAAEFELIRDVLPLGRTPLVNVDQPTVPSKDTFESPRIEPSLVDSTVTAEEADPLKPELKPTIQKGVGLKSLHQTLSIFNGANNSAFLVPTSKENETDEQKQAVNIARQTQLEKDVLQSAIQRWRLEHAEQQKKFGTNNYLYNLNGLVWEWYEALLPLVKDEIRKANEAEASPAKGTLELDRVAYGPFLQYIPPETISAIAILTLLASLTRYEKRGLAPVKGFLVRCGNTIADESMVQAIRSRANTSQERRRFALLQNSKRLAEIRRKYSQATSEYLQNTVPTWTTVTKHKIAALLLSLCLKVAKMEVTRVHPKTGQQVTEVQAAVFNTYCYERGKRIGIIKGNPQLTKRLMKEPVHTAVSKVLPMVVRPVPWTGWRTGGFLSHPTPAVRLPSGSEQSVAYLRAASKNGDMAQVFAGLDVLGRTAWRINRPMFHVMVEAWNSGVPIANFQHADPKVEYPDEPQDFDDNEARKKWIKEVRLLENAVQGSHSQRCFHNFQLEIARAYLDETFYFPHSVDFRGRAYPIPPYFNHLGADHCRGLLVFDNGKPLGAAGLAWLKVHLANVFGFDKASLSERRQFTEDHLAEVRDSATDSLNGSRWWLRAEDPWQCLAACMELKNALDLADPTAFISHLPVHQDGTCNGLQHYAALGGDPIGAEQVNLEPGDRPADVYSGVADMVRAQLQQKAAQGSQIAQMLEGCIKRKVVKQTVMTNVYGVTFTGAIEQVKKQLQAHIIDKPSKTALPITALTFEVTSAIFQSLGTMFQGATAIQHWLVDCANRISRSFSAEQISWLEDQERGIEQEPEGPYVRGKKKQTDHTRFKTSVIWTTPLKMPVVQPYRTPNTTRIFKTAFQQVVLERTSASDSVSRRKQLQGFPPNFIHSLDATHMFLTAIKCEEVGLTFASVHDSYWTHAGDVDTMNRVLREAFIRLHSDDVIGRLAAEFAVRYKGYMYKAPVRYQSSVGRKITAWRKARYGRLVGRSHDNRILNWQIKELLDETRRLRLLASEDPEERAAGEAMETPGKILSETKNPDEVMVSEEISNALGSDLGDDVEAKAVESAEDREDGAEDDVVNFGNEPLDETGNAEDVTEQLVDADVEKRKRSAERRRKQAARAKLKAPTFVWMQMSFPSIPPRGSFDVKRLIDSQYFFS